MRAIHRITALLLITAMAGGTLFNRSLVLCAGSNGHLAVELNHEATACDGASSEALDTGSRLTLDDCTDTPLAQPSSFVTRPHRDGADTFAAMPLVFSHTLCWVAPPAMPVTAARHDVKDVSFARPVALDTVVLLI